MASVATDNIPQVIDIVPASQDGKVSVKKIVRDYLQAGREALHLDCGPEILLRPRACTSTMPANMSGSRLQLPREAISTLILDKNTLVAIIQRTEAVAIKRLAIEEREGDGARAVDMETPWLVKRVIWTNPMPEESLPKLKAESALLTLRHDVRRYLRGRPTLSAWKARRLLGETEASDGPLRDALIRERLAGQREDGSWEDDVVLTARAVRELADLGLTSVDGALQRGANWLLSRPQSPHNPGMFFSTNELRQEQERIVAQRSNGRGGRFRVIKASEQRRVMAGDDLIRCPCGPRIMWPNALILEALLQLGYEDHERVRTALRFMLSRDWCECAYQHGSRDWKRTEPLTMEEIGVIEQACVERFRYGGFRGTAGLKEADLAHRYHNLRVSEKVTARGREYVLRMPDHIQGCEFITTRAMSHTQDERMRRYAAAHLWRFAGIQRPATGRFPDEDYGTGFGPYGILEAFARYDHRASRVVITRSLPWIVEGQNEDGSWGETPKKDVATLAVMNALIRLGERLPSGLIP